ncbi:glycosyltransferase [Streptomyces sp. NPDC000070]|uniref:glycosyltransferase n=1 Tax=Streptomyces sp. NPDC000070 TaxID=3154240 RepID=UPI00331FD1EF
MLTVLHVAQASEDGVARVVTDLAEAQVASGARVAVACLPDSRLAAAAADKGAEVLLWQARRAPGPTLLGEVADLRGIIRRVGPDVVHLHSSKAGLAGRLALRGRRPTVFQPHAWSFEAVTGLLRVASVRWERAGARWAHRVVCVSEGEHQRGVAAGVRAPYTTVRNGVALDHFASATAPSREQARAWLGIAASTPLVVCVARLCRQKAQDVLLAAWPEISERISGARLVLVGDGPDRAALEARAPETVSFVGGVTDPRDWYIAADVVTLPSRWEAGMALAPMEAMACARPVLVTDVPGVRESLPAAQASRVLMPPDDVRALSAALTALLSDRAACDALGRQARAYVCRHRDVHRTVERMYAVYEEARIAWDASRRPPGRPTPGGRP